MKLCENKETFFELIETVASSKGIPAQQIEKDYYITILLSQLTKIVPSLVFKGGTSLSKCYKLIDRFSEDIDLTLDQSNCSESKRKNLNHSVKAVCKSLDLKLLNESEIKSKAYYNNFVIEYPKNFDPKNSEPKDIKPNIKLETVFMQKPYPTEKKPIASIIYDYLYEEGKDEFISEYAELQPFEIQVQTLERTFIDKVFAICDYKLSNKIERNSRHLYDIYRLLDRIKLNDSLKTLAKEIRENRKKNKKCPSSEDGVDIGCILTEIISENTYKNDYETITKAMIYANKYLPYDKAVTAINRVIDSGIFE